jgi:hypothetical protein
MAATCCLCAETKRAPGRMYCANCVPIAHKLFTGTVEAAREWHEANAQRRREKLAAA